MNCSHRWITKKGKPVTCSLCGLDYLEVYGKEGSMQEPKQTFRPRNDFVLVRIVDVGESPGGIAIPEISIHGKKFLVEAIGPQVEDLSVGDSCLMIGQLGDQYYPLPNSRDLLVISEKNVVLIFEE